MTCSTTPLLVADLPFGTYHASSVDALRSAVRLLRDAPVDAIKLEGGRELASTVRRITHMGIPVTVHVGLLPQRHAVLLGDRVQGRDAAAARAAGCGRVCARARGDPAPACGVHH